MIFYTIELYGKLIATPFLLDSPSGRSLRRSTPGLTRQVSHSSTNSLSHSCCDASRKTWRNHCRPKQNRFYVWKCPLNRNSITSRSLYTFIKSSNSYHISFYLRFISLFTVQQKQYSSMFLFNN